MPEYLKDRTETVERLAGLMDDIRYAEYELWLSITVARSLGLTWTEVGAALGMTKQGASQWHKRAHPDVHSIPPEEHERVGRLIGVGEKQSRWEVRRIVSGRPGVTKVVRETVTRHRRVDVAARKVGQVERGEVWRIDPDGTEQPLSPAELQTAIRAAERFGR